MIDGCFFDDEDFDGQSYRLDWPGTNPNPFIDRLLHPTAMMFTSATTNNGRTNYSTIAFRGGPSAYRGIGLAVQSAVLRPDDRRQLRQSSGRRTVLPVLHDRVQDGGCVWQQGGGFIPGTINRFGGSSTTEYGPLLSTAYPEPGFTITHLFNNFNSGDMRNPCPVFGFGKRH